MNDVFRLVKLFFDFAFYMPFQIQFFMFPFTFGHLIYASLITCVSIAVMSRFVKGGFDRGNSSGQSGKVGK